MNSRATWGVVLVGLALASPGCDRPTIIVEPDPMSLQDTARLDLGWPIHLAATYSVAVERHDENGTPVASSGSASIEKRFDGAAGILRIHGEDALGTYRYEALIARTEDRWVLGWVDSGHGRFDLVEGAVGEGAGVLASREGSRPDGGVTRFSLDGLVVTGFSLEVTRRDGEDGFTNDARFNLSLDSTVTLPVADGPVCGEAPYRALDFWLGSWSVSTIDAASTEVSDISLTTDRCVVVERRQSDPEWLSYSMYDASSSRWQQLRVNGRGDVWLATGLGPEAGTMVFSGIVGGLVEKRVTWTRNPDGSVGAVGESRPLDGAWVVDYEERYERR